MIQSAHEPALHVPAAVVVGGGVFFGVCVGAGALAVVVVVGLAVVVVGLGVVVVGAAVGMAKQ